MAAKYTFEQSRALRILKDADHKSTWTSAEELDTSERVMTQLVNMKEVSVLKRPLTDINVYKVI